MTKILAIGNSFSQDATAHLYGIASAGGYDLELVNLVIGGCPLERHWSNVLSGAADYSYEHNSVPTDRMASLTDVLPEDAWDIITIQQASHDSGLIETYRPYAENLVCTIRENAPGARVWLHQTWAYEPDSDHEKFIRYDHDQQKMYKALRAAYAEISAELDLPVIPCGDVIQALREAPAFNRASGGHCLCRDGYHLSLDFGRYAAAAAWYERLLGGDIRDCRYVPSNVVDIAAIHTIKETVHELCGASRTDPTRPAA